LTGNFEDGRPVRAGSYKFLHYGHPAVFEGTLTSYDDLLQGKLQVANCYYFEGTFEGLEPSVGKL
jgi:hypothetical protein